MGWLAAILSGVLAGLAYPVRVGDSFMADMGFLGLVCWVPLMVAVNGRTLKKTFILTFVAGLFHFMISQFWLYSAIHNFGGLSEGLSALVLGLLIIILSAYFGLIFWLSGWICRRLKISTLWVRPVIWVGIEYLRHLGPMGGYPWSQLGYTQGGILPLMQSAEIWGAYGVTFVLVLLNELGAMSLLRLRDSRFLRPLKISVLLAILLWLGHGAFGLTRFFQGEPPAIGQIKTGVVQGNIAQEEKWDRSRARNIFSIFVQGTLDLEAQGAELVLWPEASLPFSVYYDVSPMGLRLPPRSGHLLFGAISKSRQTGARDRTVHNSALLIDSKNSLLDFYHKRELVPFGEYVPYQDLFWFARKLTAEVGNMTPGESYRPMKFGDYLMGVLICYEDIFPYIAREMVARGANVLINITNDAWYGFSSAAYQHQVYSQMRAVETRRALIRATNTGISSLIDTRGQILWQGGMFTRENFLSDLPLYQGKTLFVRVGYLLPHFFLIISAALMLLAWRKPRRNKK